MGRSAFGAVAAAAVAMLLAAPTAHAAYTTATPLSTGQQASGVAVNQSSGDAYAASGGGSTTPTVETGSLKRFNSAGSEQACALSPAPAHPESVAVNPVDGKVAVLDGANTTMSLRFFSGPCGAEIASPVSIPGTNIKALWPQIATDALGNVYVPNPTLGTVTKYDFATHAEVALAHPIAGLTEPSAVALDFAGRIYVVEPESVGVDEKQKITFSGTPSGGTFTLGNLPAACSASSTASIEFTTASTIKTNVQGALEAKCGAGNFIVVGNVTAGLVVTFQNERGKQDQPLMSCNGAGLTPSGAGCAVANEVPGASASNGRLDKFEADGTPLGTPYEGGVSSVTINRSTGELFVGRGRHATFHIEKYSSGGAKLADFGTGVFSEPGSGKNLAFNQLGVNEASGKVYATDAGHKQVQVFEFDGVNESTLTVKKTGTGEGTITSTPAGIDCGPTCTEEAAQFDEGETVTLEAEPEAGSAFTGWSTISGDPGTCTGTTSPCEVDMDAAVELEAAFSLEQLSLKVDIEGSGEGSVSSVPAAISCEPECEATFDFGETVTLEAEPETGSEFTGWSTVSGDPGTCVGTTSPCEATLEEALELEATFDLALRTLKVSLKGSGEGSVTSTPAGISCEPECEAVFDFGETVSLEAEPEAGSEFSGWSTVSGDPGTCEGTTSPCEATLEEALELEASFASSGFLALDLTVTGEGEVKCKVAGGPEEACEEEYAEGAELALVPHAGTHAHFEGWAEASGAASACSGTGECSFTLSSPAAVKAPFPLTQRNLSVSAIGEGQVKCNGGACASSYPDGTTLTLTAVPGTHSHFSGWTVTGSASVTTPCAGTTTPCEVKLEGGNVTAEAAFAITERTLSTSAIGEGEVKCDGGACASSYPDGTTLTLTAIPGAHSHFSGWTASGSASVTTPCTGTTTPCEVKLEGANVSAQATFAITQRSLTINKSGTGNGSFSCDSGSGFGACASTYADGTTVTVKATPDSESSFNAWSGSCDAIATNECEVEMDADKTISASFTATTKALAIELSGTGKGSVQCSLEGAPAAACQPVYPNGSTVTVIASAEANSYFTAWSGECASVSGSECEAQLSASRSVEATFTLKQRALAIEKAGTGDGSFSCDTGSGFGPCQASYADGKNIVIKATPDSESSFAGWEGCAWEPSPGNCAVLHIGADTIVAATFKAPVPPQPEPEPETPNNPPASPHVPVVPTPLACIVPKLSGSSLVKAKAALLTANCALGEVAKPRRHRGALAISASEPPAGAVLPAGSPVDLRLAPKPKAHKRHRHANHRRGGNR